MFKATDLWNLGYCENSEFANVVQKIGMSYSEQVVVVAEPQADHPNYCWLLAKGVEEPITDREFLKVVDYIREGLRQWKTEQKN